MSKSTAINRLFVCFHLRTLFLAVVVPFLLEGNWDVVWGQASVPDLSMSTQSVGDFGERFVAECLRFRGYCVVQNPQGGHGIDIIPYKGSPSNPSEIKIVEVKTTRTGNTPRMTEGTEQMSDSWITRQVEFLETSFDDTVQQLGRTLRNNKKASSYQHIAEVHGVDIKNNRYTIYDDILNMRPAKSDPLSISKMLEKMSKHAGSPDSQKAILRLLADYDQLHVTTRDIPRVSSAAQASTVRARTKSDVLVPQTTKTNTVGVKTAFNVAVESAKFAQPVCTTKTTALLKGADAISPSAKSLEGAIEGGVIRMGTGIAKKLPLVWIAVEIGVHGYDSYKTEQDFADRCLTQQERVENHTGNVGGCVGSVSGAFGGAYGGAALGAAVGSVVPVVGTAIGGVVGGIAGGIGGYIVGDWAADKTGRAIAKWFW